MSSMHWYSLRLCRIERCPRLQAIFPPGALDHAGRLEIMGDSDLLMARCVWSKGGFSYNLDHLKSLRHLHLRCCPSLHLALAMCRRPSLPHLETLYIIHCGNLRHVFVPDDEKIQHSSIEFPKLMTIHLHDLPALQQICEGTKMMAPALETINIRGCWSLRSLPALLGRKPGMKKPARRGGEGRVGRVAVGRGGRPVTTLPSTRRPCTRASTRGACSGAPSSGMHIYTYMHLFFIKLCLVDQ
ncbi:hypothetical protein HU200_012333 [Digitaria exilis]|uniref:Disease resistance protein At4g27190-like leucine-rich repeats domain-containing protein n=1 Tax=Digitaria exilis TaxID=1010633 RepID=A0A835FEE4_9POAL|nr:hypothetical protein HU200_012333 [Digitaria exilis]